MSLDREDVIKECCRIVALAYASIGDYTHASDGFCTECMSRGFSFQHQGKSLEYVRTAVLNQLKRDGYRIARGFDPDTGKEL